MNSKETVSLIVCKPSLLNFKNMHAPIHTHTHTHTLPHSVCAKKSAPNTFCKAKNCTGMAVFSQTPPGIGV